MTSSWLGIQTSLRGLLAQQQALDVTTHNVANASTVGYTRQQAVLTTTNPLMLSTGATATGGAIALGQGVDLQSINRIRDTFADLQFRAQNQSLGYSDETAKQLDQVQSVFSEPSDNGISNVLGKFWSAWDDLANHPETTATRDAVVNQGQLLTDSINQVSSQMTQVQSQAQTEYAQDIGPNGTVQSAATQIANLNQAIKNAVGQGAQPNDLLDQRDVLLDTLSDLGQVKVTDLGNGAIDVNFGDAATPLVADGTVTWPQTLSAPGGRLGALLQLGDPSTGKIASFLTQLDSFASQLQTSVNTAYGGTFFSGTSAATLAVAETSATLHASSLATPPAGANDAALAVAGLRSGTADQSYSALVAKIGGDVANSLNQRSTAQALQSAAQDRRQSTSGVSVDEEMVNMIQFQRGYQASARAMTTIDEMLDQLINRTGRVGL